VAPSGGGGGAMTLISTLTANNTASSLAWAGLSGYSRYLLILQNLKAATLQGVLIDLQFGTGSGPTYITTNYNYKFISLGESTTYSSNVFGGTSNSGVRLNTFYNLSTDQGLSGHAIIEGMDSGFNTTCQYSTFLNSSALTRQLTAIGAGNQITDTTTKTAIRLLLNDSEILASGTATLYGLS
jgi:hypothetical protein